MFELIGLIATGAAAVLGYIQSRRFVGGRLQYVEAAQRPSAPWIAGIAAAIIAAPITWILPLIGTGTALIFGAAVGLGAAAGREGTRRLPSG